MDMLDPQPALVQHLVRPLLLPRALLAAWLLGRHEALDLRERERQEAQILSQPAPCGQGIRGRVGNPLLMDAAATGLTEKKDREQGVDQQDLFDVSLFRLNHWLPRTQTHPEVMQGTAELHHQIADTLLPQADPVFDDAATLDTTVDMLDPPPLVPGKGTGYPAHRVAGRDCSRQAP
jgi:hypothetical protein